MNKGIRTLDVHAYNPLGFDGGPGPDVAAQIRALPGLTRLRYHGDLVNCARFLEIDGFACKLRDLDIRLTPHHDTSPAVITDFCEKLGGAKSVTSLKWTREFPDGIEIDTLLPLVLHKCPNLVSLVVPKPIWVSDAIGGTIQRLAQLKVLRIDPHVWPELLPSVSALCGLKQLGNMHWDELDGPVVMDVTALTSLTRLKASCSEGFASLEPLSRLPKLQSLWLNAGDRCREDIGAEINIRRVSHLRELAVNGRGMPVTGLSDFLGGFTSLNSLHLHCGPCPMRELLEAPWALRGLRRLSIALGGGAPLSFPELCSELRGLEMLSVSVSELSLTAHLSQLTRLTALRVENNGNDSAMLVPATFLTGLTALVDLKLRLVLSPSKAREDVPCLAMLTNLQWLVVHSQGRDFSATKDNFSASDLQNLLATRSDLQPLTALRLLEYCDLSNAWNWDGSDLDSVVNELCHLGTWSEVEEDWCRRGSAFTRPIEELYI